MDDIMYARVRHRRDTDVNWVTYDPVILNGEIILIDTEEGIVRTKIGDGISQYSKLPFHDNYELLIELENSVAELNEKVNPFTCVRFSHNKSTKEIGEVVYSYDLSWEFSKTPVSVEINGDEIENPQKTGTLSINDSPFFSEGIRKTTSWTIEGIDNKGTSARKSTTMYFYHGVYYGTTTRPNKIDSNFINGLSDKVLSGSKNRTVSIKGGSGKYFYYAYPSSYGEALFHIGGLDYEYKKEEISFENKHGVIEKYNVYVSDEPFSSNVSITIK